ncbi:MAG: hypothetical protein ABI977_17460 [Acidobacteriota bacterium]
MKKDVISILAVVILAVFVLMDCAAQAQDSEPSPDRRVGAAEVYYFKERDKTRSQVRIYLQGRPEEIGTNKDTLSIDVIFEVNGQKVTKPQFVNIAFRVYSANKSKFSNDHEMHLYTEGMEGINGSTWRTKLLSRGQLPSGGTLEVFLSPPIEYERLLRMANAAASAVTLGQAKFALKKEDFQSLKDLTKTIEK